ncbi:molybdate ABC transporter substrate-binding protein [Saccharothrix australiensis]|uniref:Molybdate transport system substrate-binding protein n=1 Tax=Saccharothrix australiensis TaxID=2072 RepID=A0A495W0Q0_9PSEU|nr:molybdate ABC transporter substrate-binding protein [Saccharothrix australiensis]RKT54323.1 molybdate transport system substrate-binding protein [Saccharothrix australiensis]
MVRRALALTAALALAGCGAPSTAVTGTVTVFAAASLTEAFTALGGQFEAAHPGVRVRFNFAGSSALARQLVEGAPADVFASAAPANLEQVVAAGGIAEPPVVFARNTLRIAVPKGNPGRVAGLADFGRDDAAIAVCAEQVPCGAAAKAVFAAAGVAPRPDTVEQDVKAALTKVRLGEVDAALVYRTDVRAAGADVEGIAFPEAERAANDYPIAPLKAAPNGAGARAFVDLVRSERGRAVLADAGFDTP